MRRVGCQKTIKRAHSVSSDLISLASNSENETPSVGDTIEVAKKVENPTSTSVAMIDVNTGIV
jgi:hypothetical protein